MGVVNSNGDSVIIQYVSDSKYKHKQDTEYNATAFILQKGSNSIEEIPQSATPPPIVLPAVWSYENKLYLGYKYSRINKLGVEFAA